MNYRLSLLILFFYITTTFVTANENYKKDQTQLDVIFSLISSMSDTVHSLQEERGASCGYISSNGNKFDEKLEAIKKRSDEKIDILNNIVTNNGVVLDNYFSKEQYNILKNTFNQIYNTRKDVKNIKLDFAKTYSKYTQSITFMLMNISNISDIIDNKELRDSLYNYSTLLMYKESIGQKRAALSSLFSKKDFKKEIFEYYLTSDTTQKIYLRGFFHNVEEDIKNLYLGLMNNDAVKSVDKYEKLALKKLSGEKVVVDPSKWFEKVTKKINLIQAIEYKIFDDILMIVDKINTNSFITLTKNEKEWMKNNPMVKIAVMNYWVSDKNGNSIHTDVLKLINKYTNLNIIPARYNAWKDGFWDASKGEDIHGIMNLSWSKQREEKYFNYTKAYNYTPHYLIVKKENKDIHSLYDLKDKTIYLKSKSITHKIIEDVSKSTKVIDLLTEEDMYKNLSTKNEAVAIILYDVDQEKLDKYNLKVVKTIYNKYSEVSIGINHKYKELSSIINKAYRVIPKELLENLRGKRYGNIEKELISLTKEERDWIKTHVVKIGVEQWSPIVFSNTGNDIDGITGDFTKIIIEQTGLKVKIVNDNWDKLLKDFKNKKIDLLPATYYTKQRSKYGLYSDSYFKMKDAIYLKDSNTEILSLKDLEGKTLAIPKGYGTIDKLKKQFPKIRLVLTKDLDDSINRVLNGRVTAFYEGKIAAESKINSELINGLKSILVRAFDTHSLHFFSNFDEPILQSIIKKALENIHYEQRIRIISKWGKEDKKLKLTASELKWLDKKQAITYVYDPDWAPFEWTNELEQHSGIIADILKLISQKTDIKFIPIHTKTWNESVEKMKNNEVNMYSAVIENEQRRKYVQFTNKSIYTTPAVLVTRTTDDTIYVDIKSALKNKKVGIVKGNALESYVKTTYPKLNFQTVKSTKDGFDKLLDEKIDIFIVNASTAQYFIKRKGYSDIRVATKIDYNFDLKLAIQNNMPQEIVSILDKAISDISEKELNDIYHKWTQVTVQTKTDWVLVGQVSGGIFLVLMLVLFNNYKLKSKVEEKTADIEKQKSELEDLLVSFDKNVIFSRTDLNGIITHVSEAFCEISGYRKEELLGNPHSMVRHPDMPKETFSELWDVLQKESCFKADIKNLKKDGSFYWVESKFEPIYDNKNNHIGYSALRIDISNKKEVEELTRNLERKVEDQTKDLKIQFEEIGKQKDFTQTLLDSQDQIIVTTLDGELISGNQTFMDFFKVNSVEDFKNIYNAICICDTFNKNAPKEYIQKNIGSKSWIEYLIENNDSDSNKVMISLFDKDVIFSVSATILPTQDGLKSAVFTNITEMENAKQEIEQILSNILLPVLITSKNERKILYANKYAQRQYELPLNKIIGSNIDDVYTVKGQHQHIVDEIKNKGFVENLEEVFKTSNGKEFTALLSVTPITYKSNDSYIGMVTDITKQKMIENEVRAIHKHTRDSIEYAALIQGALIPDNNLFRNYFKDYFVIWTPKDTVGGDIYLFNELRNEDECLLMFIDCTGHGVPGAFVTMLVKAVEREIVSIIKNNKDMEVSPAWIMQYFNKTLKKLLKQEDKNSLSNAGWDGGIVYYNRKKQILKFAGAETPLFYLDIDGSFNTIKGNRYSVGYKKCSMDYMYKETILDVKEGMKFYCTTDGYLDQNGGEKDFPFGKKRFGNIIKDYHSELMTDQKEIFLYEMDRYEKMIPNNDRNDDMTVIAFEIKESSTSSDIILEYDGVLTQGIITHSMDVLEHNISNIGMLGNISTIVIELTQNMMKYSKSRDLVCRDIRPAGLIEVEKTDDEIYYVRSKSVLSIEDKEKIEPKLIEIQSLDQAGIKKRYRELRKSGENTHSQGGGIGFYEIAKLSYGIEYKFEAINEEKFSFEFKVVVKPRKKKV